MDNLLPLLLVLALGGNLLAPAVAAPDGSWVDWVVQLRIQIDRIVQVITGIRHALVASLNEWWREGLPQVAHALSLADLAPIIEQLTAITAELPVGLRSGLQALTDRLLTQAVRDRDPGSTADSMRVAVAADPRLREAERRSIGRQATAASLVALSGLVQQATDQVAATLAQSTATVEATQLAIANAQSLQSSVSGAQSSRALLQYLGEGIADLMRQDAAFGGILSQHLAALSQQDALATRDLEVIVSLLAQDVLVQEQARRGQVAASQEALRLLAESYSQSLLAVGSSLLDLQTGSPQRRRHVLDAITPTW